MSVRAPHGGQEFMVSPAPARTRARPELRREHRAFIGLSFRSSREEETRAQLVF